MSRPDNAAAESPPGWRVLGVIEIGSSALRMEIAQGAEGEVPEMLESLQQPVSLGKDTFTSGTISSETTEACVTALRCFCKVAEEYRIAPRDLLAVATSAVREASNRSAFLDRLYIATGISVRTLDGAEVNRLTYQGVLSAFRSTPALRRGRTVVIEAGAGSTEVLVFSNGQLKSAATHRLGALRLRERFEDESISGTRLISVMTAHTRQLAASIREQTDCRVPVHLLALGGDARLAALVLNGHQHGTSQSMLESISTKQLLKLVRDIFATPVDRVVQQYHISYPEAETLGPALLICTTLAEAFSVNQIAIGEATLRDGLLSELAARRDEVDAFTQEIKTSALQLGARYRFDRDHAIAVSELSADLFDALESEHRLPHRYRILLEVAAILHDIGLFISNRSHHKHSMYLIQNSEVFGLGVEDLQLCALVARYHRRALPKATHEGYSALDREGRITVQKLASILRVADAVACDRVRTKNLSVELKDGELIMSVKGTADLMIEQQTLRNKGAMFTGVYGIHVNLINA